ncbi:hypothetical protein JN06_02707 [Bacteroides zoogleoformans]|nr:hypothetical protein JN06_02707 [Bacteroides zoogleoformans]
MKKNYIFVKRLSCSVSLFRLCPSSQYQYAESIRFSWWAEKVSGEIREAKL